MVKIHIGERVKNGRGESGVITAFDNQYITVNYPGRTASVVIYAFEKGYIKYFGMSTIIKFFLISIFSLCDTGDY